MIKYLPEFKEMLIEKVGPNWLDRVDDSDLLCFMNWAAQCQVYQMNLTPRWEYKSDIGDALRGFVTGLSVARSSDEPGKE